MKKTLGISLVAVLMTMPMMANAAPVAGDPGATASGAPTASVAPKYTLKPADNENDVKAATAGYVKGAYNAVIKGVNKTQDEISTLNTGIETYQGNINSLLNGKATKTGTVATIDSATTTESIQNSTVNISGVTTSSISATASGNVDLSVPVMGDWETNAPAANPIQTTTTFSGLTVNNLSMSAPTSNTATLTKTGIAGDVDVANYLAQAAAPTYWYTPLLDIDVYDYVYKSAIYPDGDNRGDISGLSNGEWTVIWNDYSTVQGTSMCSSDWGGVDPDEDDGYEFGYTISSTPASITDQNAPAGCWCKMTGWTPHGGTEQNMSSLWVFNRTIGFASYCAMGCANYCAGVVTDESDFRSALFRSVQQ